MIQSEIWKISIDALRANKLKAFLTMLGVVVGTACIVLVVTFGTPFRASCVSQVRTTYK